MSFEVSLPFTNNLLRVSFNYDMLNSAEGGRVALYINENLAWYTFLSEIEEGQNMKIGSHEEFLFSVQENQALFRWELLTDEKDLVFGVSGFKVDAISQ